jgi:hypothetical protein
MRYTLNGVTDLFRTYLLAVLSGRRLAMLINIEREYSDFIENLWHNLSNSTKDILDTLESRRKPDYYNFVSLRLTQFFQLELQNLEAKSKPAKP